MVELKRCPFCGEEARTVESECGLYDVSCKNGFCYAYMASNQARYYELDDAIKEWNRRAENV